MHKERTILSVIVPVYNVEKYLRECIDSILAQDVEDMEVILVDDGSTDGSGKLCDEYAEKDGRVTVVHKENGGVSTARNAGLDISQGKYITFVDSDDFLLPNSYRPNVEYMETHPEIDLLQFPMIYDKRIEYVKRYKQQKEEIVFSGNDVLLNWWDGKVIHFFVISKIYKREIFKNLRFQIGAFSEDAIISPELSKRCQKVFLSMKGGYYYRYTEGSLMHSSWGKKKFMDFFRYRLLIWERVDELEYMNTVKIKAYLRTLIILAMCAKKGYLNYNDYDEFLDSIPPIRLLPRSKKLGLKGGIAYLSIKLIGARRFVKLYRKV